MSHRPPCRLYRSRGGCRYGANCRFSHSDGGPAGPSNPSHSSTSSRTPARGGRGRGNGPNSGNRSNTSSTPQDTRRNGSTPGHRSNTSSTPQDTRRNGSNANAGHRSNASSTPQDTRRNGPNAGHRGNTSLTPEDATAAIAPFLTEKGLAKIGTVATDGFFGGENATSMSPTVAHGRIRRFLEDDYKFKTVSDIYAFLGILNSANSNNPLWSQTPEEAQLLLKKIIKDDGTSPRIAEILAWPAVSMTAGSNRTTLSFQRGILPLLRYLSSEYVVKSIQATCANTLYNVVLQNIDRLADTIESCMQQAMVTHSFKDPNAALASSPIDTQVFASIAGLLHEILVRFMNVVFSHPRVPALVVNLEKWFQQWQDGVNASPPLFQDPFGPEHSSHVREHLTRSITDRISRLVAIVERERRKESKTSSTKPSVLPAVGGNANEALVSALHTTFQGPGDLNPDGPRHDNDHEDIQDIKVAPTHQELLCRTPPYLPANFFSAPHHAPGESMQRLLDIQFRLLREELTAPLRKAVQLVYEDLRASNPQKTKLSPLLTKKGGKYHGLSDSQESIMFNVYTGVQFDSLVAGWKGLSTTLVIDTPPGKARSERPGARKAFWDTMGGKRLMQGGLVALLWEHRGEVAVSLGIVTSNFRDQDLQKVILESSQELKMHVCFFDPTMELRILQNIRSKSKYDEGGLRVLVESPIMYEAVRPFLEALKTEPEDLPFSKYLVHRPPGFLEKCDLDPPQYARVPNFSFQLASLFPPESGVSHLELVASDPSSVNFARAQLRNSRLDPSQADAMIDALTREVALIQGPPGTGKSYTGVEILRVLSKNNIGPILMIAFTNHALDHMLVSVLKAGITDQIVRLGGRSSDELIQKYSIEELERSEKGSRLTRAYAARRWELQNIQRDIEELMRELVNADVEKDSTLLDDHIQSTCPEHHKTLMSPPQSIVVMRQLIVEMDGGDAGAWQRIVRGGRREQVDDSLYAFWKDARDHKFLTQVLGNTIRPWKSPPPPPPAPSNAFATLDVELMDDLEQNDHSDDDEEVWGDAEETWDNTQYDLEDSSKISKEYASNAPIPEDPTPDASSDSQSSPGIHDIPSFLSALGYAEPPQFSTTDRPLTELLDDSLNTWNMSSRERLRLHNFWVEEARRNLAENQTREFQELRDLHAQRLTECNEGQAEARRNLLRSVDIIGCTTTGAAKLTPLLKALSPQVLLVEEAGQVMESHILGSLVPSIEHLILIGDPLQLRPTLNNFSLSMDSRRGRELYRFDMSLMERLSTSGLAMSRIDVQRRMRPAISSLIRNTLYEGLEDHPLVTQYPDVRGMGKNVFFLNHTHPENDGGDESSSKFNTFEVKMIRDLVLYLLRQGCYSDEGDIVVLCAYLGQLARLRDVLSQEIAVVIDERDQAALNDADDSDADDYGAEPTIERVNVAKRVRLRTVDNYQGEEGQIVILSLVRNAGDPEEDISDRDRAHRRAFRSTIGFLKSENRTNGRVIFFVLRNIH